MKLFRTVYIVDGTCACYLCGAVKHGPCEVYEYVMARNSTIRLCFDCRLDAGRIQSGRKTPQDVA